MRRINCPLCAGKGHLEILPKKAQLSRERRQLVVKLRKAGYTIREISKMLNFKSTTYVQKVIKDSMDGDGGGSVGLRSEQQKDE
jgi:transposase